MAESPLLMPPRVQINLNVEIPAHADATWIADRLNTVLAACLAAQAIPAGSPNYPGTVAINAARTLRDRRPDD